MNMEEFSNFNPKSFHKYTKTHYSNINSSEKRSRPKTKQSKKTIPISFTPAIRRRPSKPAEEMKLCLRNSVRFKLTIKRLEEIVSCFLTDYSVLMGNTV